MPLPTSCGVDSCKSATKQERNTQNNVNQLKILDPKDSKNLLNQQTGDSVETNRIKRMAGNELVRFSTETPSEKHLVWKMSAD